jgi:hypothetical protein
VLPQDLASDIQLFSESDYARQYFSTHRTGFIFRRKVPLAQMMAWQKVAPFFVHTRTRLIQTLDSSDWTFVGAQSSSKQRCREGIQSRAARYGRPGPRKAAICLDCSF